MDWEAQQPERHEWVDGKILAVTRARDAHNRINGNVLVTLHQALRGATCRVYATDMKLHVQVADAVFYPDVL